VGRAARILVVDDNETLRTLVAQVLEAEGYVAIAADSAETALDVAGFAPPDLFLIDHVMPGMSGADLIRALRTSSDERLHDIPAIGLSAYDRGRYDLVVAGALCAVGKPVAYAALLEAVRGALGEGRSGERRAPA